MARYTFVTESHLSGDEKKTVEILSRSEVEDIAVEAAKAANSSLARRISSLDRKLAKAAEQVAAAGKDATAAEEEVKRLVETARETFREVIEEMLAPHYRLLAQHLGIELPDQLTGMALKNRAASTRETASAAFSSDESISAKISRNTTRQIKGDVEEDHEPPARPKRKAASAAKTSMASKKKKAQLRSFRKGDNLCRYE